MRVIIVSQVPYEYPPAGPDTDSSEESGGDAALAEEGPTECDCEPGEPGFAGFAGPKVPAVFLNGHKVGDAGRMLSQDEPLTFSQNKTLVRLHIHKQMYHGRDKNMTNYCKSL